MRPRSTCLMLLTGTFFLEDSQPGQTFSAGCEWSRILPGHWFDCATSHRRSCCCELLEVLPAAILAVTAAGRAGSHLPADLTHAAQEAVSCLYSLLQTFGLAVASADGQPGAEGICLTADAMMSILQVGAADSCMAQLYLPLCTSRSMAGPMDRIGFLMLQLDLGCLLCSMCILMPAA